MVAKKGKPFYKTISIDARKLMSWELKEKASKVRLRAPEKKKILANICMWASCWGVKKDFLLLARILVDQKLVTVPELDEMAKWCEKQAQARAQVSIISRSWRCRLA